MSKPKFRHFTARTSRRKVEKGLVPIFSHATEETIVVGLQDVFLSFISNTTCDLVWEFLGIKARSKG